MAEALKAPPSKTKTHYFLVTMTRDDDAQEDVAVIVEELRCTVKYWADNMEYIPDRQTSGIGFTVNMLTDGTLQRDWINARIVPQDQEP